MKQKLFKLPPFVSIVLKKDDKILLVERKNTKWYSGYFVLPGGKVEESETIFQAAARELKEELGINLDPESSTVVHISHFKTKEGLEGLNFYVQVEKWQGEIKNKEPEKQGQIKWFDISEFPQNTFPGHQSAVDEINRKIFYSELGWE
ncbi:NUDIX domain-containing protein [Candidatus Dependentiae bacterium]